MPALLQALSRTAGLEQWFCRLVLRAASNTQGPDGITLGAHPAPAKAEADVVHIL